MLNDNNIFLVRNGSGQAQPFGTGIDMNALSYFYSFYGQDTWRLRPSITLTYGLAYSFQTPFEFANQAEAFMVDASNNQILSANAYLHEKQAAAEAGGIYNPTLGFERLNASGHSSVYNTDYGNVAPRVSLAWNPTFKEGLLGKAFGAQKTVLRGGFGIYYGRLDSEDSIVSPGLTSGPNSTITTGLQTCAASGTPGAGCVATTSGNPGSALFAWESMGTSPSQRISQRPIPLFTSQPVLTANLFPMGSIPPSRTPGSTKASSRCSVILGAE